jgi:RecA/RadA recombinase
MNEEGLKLLLQLNKHFKKPLVHSAAAIPKRDRIRSKIIAADYAATGGIPINGIIELTGPNSSGKTWFAMQIIREFQQMDWNNRIQGGITGVDYKEKKVSVMGKKGVPEDIIVYIPTKIHSLAKGARRKNVVLIDQENTYDADWGAYLGVDNKGLIHVVPETGEQGVDAMEAFIKNPETSLVVYDSIATARPSAEIEKSMEDQVMANHARFWNRASMKIQAALNSNPESDVTVILINRTYMKVGVIFGNPEQTASGSGVAYAKHMSLDFRAGKVVTGEVDGVKDVSLFRNLTIENKKNKTGKPFRWADACYIMNDDPEVDLKYGQTDEPNDVTELGLRLGIIQKQGNSLLFGRVKEPSRDKFVQYLRDHPKFMELIANKILES